MSIQDLQDKMRSLALKVQEIRNDTTKTVAERMTALAAAEADMKSTSDELKMHQKAAELAGLGGAPSVQTRAVSPFQRRRPTASDLAAEFVSLPGFKAAQESFGRSSFSFGGTLGLKAAADVAEGTTISGGFLSGIGGSAILPDYVPGVVPIRYPPLAVAQLFEQATTDSPIVSYVKQSAETIAAAGTSESAASPQADTTLARVNEQVGEISVIEKLTDEFVKDAPGLQSWLQNLLVNQVNRAEDNAVLNDTGYPSVQGILQRTGLQTALTAGTIGTPDTIATAQNIIEEVFAQITAIEFNEFLEPDTIVFNPSDWSKVRLGKDANGQYYGGGPFTGAYGNQGPTNVHDLWGYRVVVTPRIAVGTALVGDFSSATLFHRQGVTVEMSNSDGTDFQNRIVTTRVTLRAALMVPYPGGFGKVTIVES